MRTASPHWLSRRQFRSIQSRCYPSPLHLPMPLMQPHPLALAGLPHHSQPTRTAPSPFAAVVLHSQTQQGSCFVGLVQMADWAGGLLRIGGVVDACRSRDVQQQPLAPRCLGTCRARCRSAPPAPTLTCHGQLLAAPLLPARASHLPTLQLLTAYGEQHPRPRQTPSELLRGNLPFHPSTLLPSQSPQSASLTLAADASPQILS